MVINCNIVSFRAFLLILFYQLRLRASGRPFIAFDPGMTRDALAYHGCSELFQVPALNSEGTIGTFTHCPFYFKSCPLFDTFLFFWSFPQGCACWTHSAQKIMDEKTWDNKGAAFCKFCKATPQGFMSIDTRRGRNYEYSNFQLVNFICLWSFSSMLFLNANLAYNIRSCLYFIHGGERRYVMML